MSGVSVGFFSVRNIIGDVEPIAARIKEICGPSSAAFPFVASPVKENNVAVLSYAVIRGHVPIHIDRRNANEKTPAMFMFVIQAENRPVLLAAPASRENSQVVLVPDTMEMPKMGFGALELWPGRAIHMNITEQWHGITGFPTGDLVPDLPEAVMIQVPWPRADDIGGAINAMQRIIRADERFADLVTVKPQ